MAFWVGRGANGRAVEKGPRAPPPDHDENRGTAAVMAMRVAAMAMSDGQAGWDLLRALRPQGRTE